MGLDATVGCNCIKNGLVVIPEQFKPFITLDKEGYYTLDLPYTENKTLHQTFWSWHNSACSHNRMNYAHERIGNWTTVRNFQSVLFELNDEPFASLLSAMPNSNGGTTSATDAQTILHQLDQFDAVTDYGERVVLFDVDTGGSIHQYIPTYSKKYQFYISSHLSFALEPAGFFVENNDGKRLFFSTRFKQILHEPAKTESHSGGKVTFIDQATDEIFTGTLAIGSKQIRWPDGQWKNEQGKVRFHYPEQLGTEIRQRTGDDFTYITTALRNICLAAIKMDNPIRWC